jgi:nitronate monooxygenase
MFSFIFGLLGRHYLEACRKEKILTMGTATTLDEALALEASGVDAVVIQGTEAGAHHGIFSTQADDPGITALELTRACSAKLKIPVVAAGGLMTGGDIEQVLKAGAQAAMLGTAFLLCPETGTSRPYRQALRDGAIRKARTRMTRAFSGRLARGIENEFLLEMDKKTSSILPFPAQNAFTRDIRNQASKLGRPEFLSLWAGAGLPKIREMGAGDLIRALAQELGSDR